MSTKGIEPAEAKKANDAARKAGGGQNGRSGTTYAGESLAEQDIQNQDLTHNFRVSGNKSRIVHPSLDGEKLVVVDGKGQSMEIAGLPLDQDLMFDPDGRKLAFLKLIIDVNPIETGIGLADVTQRGAKPKTLYRTKNMLRGLEWSPSGEALYFLEGEELANGEQLWYLKRVGVDGVGAIVVAKSYTFIDFFMPPVSRFENSQGASKKPYRVLYGSSEGLYVVNPDGRGKERITEVAASGVDNLEWNPNPDEDMILVTYKIPRISAEKLYQGVMLFRREKKGWKAEQLYEDFDVHTLWWSPNGRYACFGTLGAVYVHDLKEKDPSKAMTRIVVPPAEQPEKPEDGSAPLPPPPRHIRGFYWGKKSDQMVIAAGNCIFMWRPDAKEDEENPVLIHEEGDPYQTFLGDCYIMDNGRIVYTAYSDNEYVPPQPAEKPGQGD